MDNLFRAMGPTSYDFGTVAPGAKLRHRFQFRNIYQIPILITTTRVSSAWAEVETRGQTPLQPGEVGWIDITLDTGRFTGSRTASIHVTVGDLYVSTATLRLSANVRRQDDSQDPEDHQTIQFSIPPAGNRSFRIPIDMEASMRTTMEKVVLYFSRDRGKTWTKAAEQSPEKQYFDFTAAEDGMHWFAIRMISKAEFQAPLSTNELAPTTLKLIVKTGN
jgi:hypothetical protein